MCNEDLTLGQMRCPNCGRMRPTIPAKCSCGYDPADSAIPKYRIYKYKLSGSVQQKLSLPKHSVLLRAALVQGSEIYLYARVNPLVKEMDTIEIGVLGTGWDIPDIPLYDPDNHLLTVEDDWLVWHIFVCAPNGSTLKIARS